MRPWPELAPPAASAQKFALKRFRRHVSPMVRYDVGPERRLAKRKITALATEL
jgi:hypothetical protein